MRKADLQAAISNLEEQLDHKNAGSDFVFSNDAFESKIRTEIQTIAVSNVEHVDSDKPDFDFEVVLPNRVYNVESMALVQAQIPYFVQNVSPLNKNNLLPVRVTQSIPLTTLATTVDNDCLCTLNPLGTLTTVGFLTAVRNFKVGVESTNAALTKQSFVHVFSAFDILLVLDETPPVGSALTVEVVFSGIKDTFRVVYVASGGVYASIAARRNHSPVIECLRHNADANTQVRITIGTKQTTTTAKDVIVFEVQTASCFDSDAQTARNLVCVSSNNVVHQIDMVQPADTVVLYVLNASQYAVKSPLYARSEGEYYEVAVVTDHHAAGILIRPMYTLAGNITYIASSHPVLYAMHGSGSYQKLDLSRPAVPCFAMSVSPPLLRPQKLRLKDALGKDDGILEALALGVHKAVVYAHSAAVLKACGGVINTLQNTGDDPETGVLTHGTSLYFRDVPLTISLSNDTALLTAFHTLTYAIKYDAGQYTALNYASVTRQAVREALTTVDSAASPGYELFFDSNGALFSQLSDVDNAMVRSVVFEPNALPDCVADLYGLDSSNALIVTFAREPKRHPVIPVDSIGDGATILDLYVKSNKALCVQDTRNKLHTFIVQNSGRVHRYKRDATCQQSVVRLREENDLTGQTYIDRLCFSFVATPLANMTRRRGIPLILLLEFQIAVYCPKEDQ